MSNPRDRSWYLRCTHNSTWKWFDWFVSSWSWLLIVAPQASSCFLLLWSVPTVWALCIFGLTSAVVVPSSLARMSPHHATKSASLPLVREEKACHSGGHCSRGKETRWWHTGESHICQKKTQSKNSTPTWSTASPSQVAECKKHTNLPHAISLTNPLPTASFFPSGGLTLSLYLRVEQSQIGEWVALCTNQV